MIIKSDINIILPNIFLLLYSTSVEASAEKQQQKKKPSDAFFLSVEVNSPQSPVCERTDYESAKVFEIRK